MTGTSAPKEVTELVERFARNRDSYLAGGINETQLRQEFINPFFSCLGWDIENKQGYAPAYREVIFEDSLRVGAETKAPDYCFRIGGMRKFFVEAKKPAVNIATGVAPAFQLKRYAWTAKLPLSILTDFEEFAVYDCRARPFKTDKPSIGRIKFLEFKDYPVRWTELYDTFSRDAVVKGSFDKFVEENRARKGTTEVDDAFLSDIERWRDLLARNIALRNPRLTTRELNFAVQRTIDRIIFLRICEDRLIEPYGQLQALLNGERVYPRLKEAFQRADDRYNSGIFHFRPEKNRPEAPDELSLKLSIDDKALKDIIANLYYPDSPYEFSVFPSEILGQVYEQFLGKVIRLTAGHQAKVEDKPEVRKAGGVYYTPTYIVDYIVKNTVGKLLDGSSSSGTTEDTESTEKRARSVKSRSPTPASRPLIPAQASRLRILDPACGSGSFLLGAYQYLLNWHRDWYVKDGPEKHTKELFPAQGGDWRLTTAKKKEILLNNIYGVDIDQQAVEVTKLSLLLKVLEGENEQTIGSNLKLWHDRALPDLGNNIKCGNSLIGPDFYQGEQQSLFDDEEQRIKVNAFDWQAEFPDIMKAGGFDAVVGNPPYIRVQALNEWTPESLPYFGPHYKSASQGNYDIYVIFVEKGLGLLDKHGLLGFILPHKFFNAQYGEALRSVIAKGKHLSHVVHFGDQQVFEGASTYTCLMFLSRAETDELNFTKVDDLAEWQRTGMAASGTASAKSVTNAEWSFAVGKGGALLEKLQRMPVKLEDATERIFQGIKTSADKIYIVEERDRKKGVVTVYSPQLEKEFRLEPDLLHPLIKGGDSKSYHLTRTRRLILFPYAKRPESAVLIPEVEMVRRYPLTWRYLMANKDYLWNREHGRMRGAGWYGYGRSQALDVMALPKIFTPDIAPRAAYSLDETGEAFFTGGVAGGYGLLVLPEHSREYVLGLLNSSLLDWFIKQTATSMRGGWYSFESRFIRHLPIRTIDGSSKTDKVRLDKMVSLVERMLKLHKDLPKARSSDKTAIERQIAATDRQIDQLVYELYGLTEEEIRIVEGAHK